MHYASRMASELAPKHIRVNTVSPGNIYFEGGIWQQIERNLPDLFKKAFDLNPWGRMGTDQEIANAAVFLASPVSSFTTGANLVVDGGADPPDPVLTRGRAAHRRRRPAGVQKTGIRLLGVEGDGLALDADLGQRRENDAVGLDEALHLEHRLAPVVAPLLEGQDAEAGTAGGLLEQRVRRARRSPAAPRSPAAARTARPRGTRSPRAAGA